MQTLLLSVMAISATCGGFCLMIMAPFLPLFFLDLPSPPIWLNQWTQAGAGLVVTILGIWLWSIAWKRLAPKKKAELRA